MWVRWIDGVRTPPCKGAVHHRNKPRGLAKDYSVVPTHLAHALY